ncbi:MAG: hypothetical protein QOC61_1286 [Acidobacteriota bacterium]|jgi:hypothetical protein|nr:hypothetical protein [Acidobacteriota bacterium]
MMNETFLQKLSERQSAPPEVEPVEMTFDGIPCKARPLSLEFYIRSGRMPDYLARIVLSGCNPQTVESELAGVVTPDALLAGQKFQRVAVCRVLDTDPRVVDTLPEETPADSLSYMRLAESAPKFVDAVFAWVLKGCPLPVEGSEGKADEADALENFPEKPRGGKRVRAGSHGKAKRKTTCGASAVADSGAGAQV